MSSYVTPATVERRLYGDAAYYGVETGDWAVLLNELIVEASDAIDALTEQTFDDANPPSVIRNATVTIVRDELHDIREQGLSSESDAAGNQQSYVDPGTVRQEVINALTDAGYIEDEDDEDEWWAVTR